MKIPKLKIPPLPGKLKKVIPEDPMWTVMKNMIDMGLEARRPFERQWLLSIAFLHGRQYTFFNTTTHAIQVAEVKRGKKRIIDNIILPKWRRQVNDWIRSNPTMSVVPNSNDEDDINGANAGNRFMQHFWRIAEMKKKNRRLGGWVHSTGNGFLVDRWDRDAGPEVVDRKTGEIAHAGDVSLDVWSPFELLVPNAMIPDIQDSPWIILRRWRFLSYLASNFKKGKDVVAEEDNISQTTSLIDGVAGQTAEGEPGAWLNELYIKPCAEFPRGKFIVAANGIVLEELNFAFEEYPITHFKDIEFPGCFWGFATMDSAIPLQTIWNETLTSLYQFTKIMAKGKWLFPRGINAEEDPNNEHGEVIHYDSVLGKKPEHVDVKGLPANVENLLMLLKRSLEDVFSQHEVSQGTNKSDIRSGDMVGRLREQDVIGGLVGTHAIYEESLEKTMSRVLRRVQTGYTAERMIKIFGKDGDFEVEAFQGADLKNNTDVHVVRQSSIADSRLDREQQVITRYQAGLYGDPLDPEVRRHVMRMLDDAVIKDIYSDTIADETYAKFENRIMMEGKGDTQVLVNPFDNHVTHKKEHNKWRKSMEYQKLKLTNFEQWVRINMGFEEHQAVHDEYIAEQQKLQMQQMMLMKGGLKSAGT